MEERVAHFADIDTRRAMGFPPRKLNINFEVPEWTRTWEPLWGGSVLFKKGDSMVWRSMEFDTDVYRCRARNFNFVRRLTHGMGPSPPVNVPNHIIDGIEPRDEILLGR
jgi:hypothetical protein